MSRSDRFSIRLTLKGGTAGANDTDYWTNGLEQTVYVSIGDKAYFTPTAATAANATNYATVALKVGSDTLGSMTTETVAMAAGTSREFTGAAGYSYPVAQGETISLAKTYAASGADVVGHADVIIVTGR